MSVPTVSSNGFAYVQRPSSLEDEQAALATALVSRKSLFLMLDQCDAGDFFHSPHPRLFEAMRFLRDERPDEQVDPVAVVRTLQEWGETDARVLAYPLSLVDGWTDPSGMSGYLRVIREKSELRFLQEAFEEGLGLLREPGAKPEAVSQHAMHLLLSRSRNDRGEPVRMSAVVRQEQERIRQREAVTLLKTGIKSLDRLLGGLAPGDLTFLGARPGAGKTTLAAHVLLHGAVTWGPMLFISLEMDAAQVTLREFARLSRFTFQELRECRREDGALFTAGDVEEIVSRTEALMHAAESVWIDCHSYQLSRLVARCFQMVQQQGVRAVVVDYGQLVQDDRGRKNQGKTEEVMRVARALKNEVASPLRIPVLSLAAVSREVEKRSQGGRGEDRKPALLQMSDLGWSSELEAVAQQIMFLNPDPDLCHLDHEGLRHVLFEVVKNRNGKTGKARLQFFGPRFEFRETETQQVEPPRSAAVDAAYGRMLAEDEY